MPPAEGATMEKNYLWRVYGRLAGVIMLCVVLAAVVSFFSQRVFERSSSSSSGSYTTPRRCAGSP
jgi:hypothetical protein